MIFLPVYLGGDISGVDDFILSVVREVSRGKVIGNLEFQVTDRQMVVVELHCELRWLTGVVGTICVRRAVPDGIKSPNGRTRPELDAEGGHPSGIAIERQYEVALVVDSKDFCIHILYCCCYRCRCNSRLIACRV